MRADFLAELWGEGPGFGEIRTIKEGKVSQAFYELNADGIGILEASGLAERYDAGGRDVYFGVLPRTRQSGKAEDCPTITRTLWADVDAKSFPGKDIAMLTINAFPITPQFLVDSGNGYHAYWLLERAIPFERAQITMKGIAKAIGGDSVSDAPRVLRLPGTHNHKNGLLVPVRLLRFDLTKRYRFSDFVEWEDKGKPARVLAHRSWDRPLDPRSFDELPDWLQELIRDGAPQGQRSEAAFKACVWLCRYGWTDDEIESLFAAHEGGIGAKYVERGSRWLDTTMRAAREAA